MRSVAIGLLALAGCNQIFGLDPVTIVDAPGQIDIITEPPLPTVQLTFMVARTTNDSQPSAALDFPPIPDIQMVRAGRLDEDLVETVYDADTGGVGVFTGLSGTPWRLEYTRLGQPPVEVQWTAEVGGGHFIEPIYGRFERKDIPANSGYLLNLSNPPAFVEPRLLTSGIWYDVLVPGAAPPFTVRMDQQTPLSGVRGAPDSDDAFNDTLVLANYAPLGACERITGSATYVNPPALTGTIVAALPDPTFGIGTSHTPTILYTPQTMGAANLEVRLKGALAGPTTRATPNTSARAAIAMLPHDAMPLFTNPVASVPAPFGIPWVDCTVNGTAMTPPTTIAPYSSPTALANFPHLAYARMSNVRVFGARLESSIVGTATAASNVNSFAPDFNVPFVIHPIQLGALILTQQDNSILLGTGRLDLTFELETGGNLKADFVEAVLYRIPLLPANPDRILVPERVYVLANPTVKKIVIDQAVFRANTDYVFALRVVRGRPSAASNDFRPVLTPQSVSSVFTHVFHVD
jgi:hypothetical protein